MDARDAWIYLSAALTGGLVAALQLQLLRLQLQWLVEGRAFGWVVVGYPLRLVLLALPLAAWARWQPLAAWIFAGVLLLVRSRWIASARRELTTAESDRAECSPTEHAA